MKYERKFQLKTNLKLFFIKNTSFVKNYKFIPMKKLIRKFILLVILMWIWITWKQVYSMD